MASHSPSNVPSLPGVTVTISAYNYAKFLPYAVESVLKQDYPCFELIIVDDGSKDNTAEVAEDYATKYPDRVRYVYQTNAGLSAARNTGIREARFDYIAFLDADDEFTPSMLRQLMETFAQLPSDYALVACRTSYMNEKGEPLVTKMLMPNTAEEITSRELIFANRFSADAVVAKKSIFKEVGDFDTTLKSCEDRDMWIRIGTRARICLIPDLLLRVRRHLNSMSKHADRMKQNGLIVIDKAKKNGVVSSGDILYWMRVRSFACFQAAWMYRDEGRRMRALCDMAKSILFWPIFPQPRKYNEPELFRVRAMARFLLEMVGAKS